MRSWMIAAALTVTFLPLSAEAAFIPNVTRHSRRIVQMEARKPLPGNSRRVSVSDVRLDKTFESKEFGFTIRHPSTWEVMATPEVSPPLTLAVMFLSPKSRTNDIRQNINLVIEEFEKPLSLAEYTHLGIATEKNAFQEYTVLLSRDITLGTKRAHQIIFTAKVPDGTMKFMQIWTVNGMKAHVWTFADIAETFDKNLPTFERMMESLQNNAL